jgi:hypothetical protein
MTLDRDIRRLCYVITIPREEVKDIFIQAHNAKGEYTEDEIASKILANKILHLIGADKKEST